MARESIDFLAESALWSETEQDGEYAVLDDELRAELVRHREHVLAMRIAAAPGLSAALGARERLGAPEDTVKRSALYFGEVLLPDSIFDLTDWTRERTFQLVPEEAPRADLVQAVRYTRWLVPLVRFVPSRRDLEDPEKSLLLYSDDELTEAGARLSPVSNDTTFKPILLTPDDEETTIHLARFIDVVHLDDSEVTE